MLFKKGQFTSSYVSSSWTRCGDRFVPLAETPHLIFIFFRGVQLVRCKKNVLNAERYSNKTDHKVRFKWLLPRTFKTLPRAFEIPPFPYLYVHTFFFVILNLTAFVEYKSGMMWHNHNHFTRNCNLSQWPFHRTICLERSRRYSCLILFTKPQLKWKSPIGI